MNLEKSVECQKNVQSIDLDSVIKKTVTTYHSRHSVYGWLCFTRVDSKYEPATDKKSLKPVILTQLVHKGSRE